MRLYWKLSCQKVMPLPHRPERWLSRLRRVTHLQGWPVLPGPEPLFLGHIHDTAFRLALFVPQPDSFMPQITGHIEPTRSGSLLWLRMSVFRSTWWILAFWFLFDLGVAVYFLLAESNLLRCLICLLVGLACYFVAVLQFSRRISMAEERFGSVAERVG